MTVATRNIKPGENWAFTEHRSQGDMLAELIAEQESDALDDGFPYEHMGRDIQLDRAATGWITPTPFMIVALKQLLQQMVVLYGRRGHPLLVEIGSNQKNNFAFVEELNLPTFIELLDQAIKYMPNDELKRLGFIE